MEQRKESRLKADQRVTVTAVPFAGTSVSGRLLDISDSGVRLQLADPLQCGSSVRVVSGLTVIEGEVSRCDIDGDGYNIGLMVSKSEGVDRVIIGV
jgi:hypothetical protein